MLAIGLHQMGCLAAGAKIRSIGALHVSAELDTANAPSENKFPEVIVLRPDQDPPLPTFYVIQNAGQNEATR